MVWVLGSGIVFCCMLAWLHAYTDGRSSPVAALAFVLCGPVLGVILILPAAVAEMSGSPRMGEGVGGARRIYGFEFTNYAILTPVFGLFAAVCAAGCYSVAIADELWRRRDSSRHGSPRPVPSAALAALGLNAFATLDDVERAYRELAMQVHPDRGGDAAAFKRLQKHYERAKKHVHRRRPERRAMSDAER